MGNCIGPQNIIRKWNSLGTALDIGLEDAKKGRLIEDGSVEEIATNSFKNFLRSAMDEKNLVYCGGDKLFKGLPLVVGGKNGNYVCDGIHTMRTGEGCASPDYGDMSMKINDYLLNEKNFNSLEFDNQYSKFIRDWWSTATNVLVAPKLRRNFGEEAKKYKEFIVFLREKADDKDSMRAWNSWMSEV